MSPREQSRLARDHLQTAVDALERSEMTVVVTFLHLAAEAAIVSLADREGIDTGRRHDRKAEAAHSLAERGVLEEDLSQLLRRLNELRKDVTYEGDDVDLTADDLREIADRIEAVVAVAEARELGE